MPEQLYLVEAVGGLAMRKGGMPLAEAEARAQDFSRRNASRYIAYAVTVAGWGENRGKPVSLWVRGQKFSPDAKPRAEAREDFMGAPLGGHVIARIPVAEGDENWSVNAASRIGMRTACYTVVLVGEDGAETVAGDFHAG